MTVSAYAAIVGIIVVTITATDSATCRMVELKLGEGNFLEAVRTSVVLLDIFPPAEIVIVQR